MSDALKARGDTWSVSALYGSPDKGAGVLNNELYIGRVLCESVRNAASANA
jgi:hypothetical protein